MRIAVMLMLTMTASGCGYEVADGVSVATDGTLRVATLKGHEYVVARGGNGIAVVHAASCTCMLHKGAARKER